jgi:hypothetical protein
MASCWMTNAPPTRRKSRPRFPNARPQAHYAKQISGDVGQGARPGPADPNEELWGLIQSRTR